MQNPLVSLIIPVREGFFRLGGILQSARESSGSIEIIVVADADDESKKHFSAPAGVRFIVAQTRGLGAARNYGIKHARGEFISFCDSDDQIDARTLVEQAEILKNSDCDLLICPYYRQSAPNGELFVEDPSKYISPRMMEGFADRNKLVHCFAFCWCKIYRSSYVFLNRLTFPDGEYEDVNWGILSIAHANKILLGDQPFYRYMFRHGSAKNMPGSQHRKILSQYHSAIEQLPEGSSEKFAVAVWMQAIRHVLFVLCGTSRLEYNDRRGLLRNLTFLIRENIGIIQVLRAEDLSLYNKILITFKSSLLVELKRLAFRVLLRPMY